MAGINFRIIGCTNSGQKIVIKDKVSSQSLINFLNKNKSTIDALYSKISVERSKDSLKLIVSVGNDKNWINNVSRVFKLGRTIKNTHTFYIQCEFYKDNTAPVCNMKFDQSSVFDSGKSFQNVVFEKMFDMESVLRVMVLRIIDVSIDKEFDDITKSATVYSHAFYPADITVPNLTGTGMNLRGGTDKKERCTPVMFNKKRRNGRYFGNTAEVQDAFNRVIEEFSKYGRRNLKTNEREN